MPVADAGGTDPATLRGVLLASREAGFLGPGPIDRHIRHAEGFATLALARTEPGARLLDLGSGGGLPGLVVAARLPSARVVLLEANQRRAQFLERAVVTCALENRVSVVHQRAELCGRDPSYRGQFTGVFARSFGPPSVVAECGAPFLLPGGWLVVSEPPSEGVHESRRQATDTEEGGEDSGRRWPADQLARFGLEPGEFVRDVFGFQILWQREPCPERFPRRNGIPSKRPLF